MYTVERIQVSAKNAVSCLEFRLVENCISISPYLVHVRSIKRNNKMLLRLFVIVQQHRHGTLQCLVTIVSLHVLIDVGGSDEILPA